MIFGSTGLARENFPGLPVAVYGMVGGAANSLVVTPVELIRNSMMLQRHTRISGFSALRQTISSHGVLGLWRGLFPTVCRFFTIRKSFGLNFLQRLPGRRGLAWWIYRHKEPSVISLRALVATSPSLCWGNGRTMFLVLGHPV